jgi:hypothetical protein
MFAHFHPSGGISIARALNLIGEEIATLGGCGLAFDTETMQLLFPKALYPYCVLRAARGCSMLPMSACVFILFGVCYLWIMVLEVMAPA